MAHLCGHFPARLCADYHLLVHPMKPLPAPAQLTCIRRLKGVRRAYVDGDTLHVYTYPVQIAGRAIGCFHVSIKRQRRWWKLSIRNTTRVVPGCGGFDTSMVYHHPHVWAQEIRPDITGACLGSARVSPTEHSYYIWDEVQQLLDTNKAPAAVVLMMEFLHSYPGWRSSEECLDMWPRIRGRKRRLPTDARP